MDYEYKYLKYKNKYLKLKYNQTGGFQFSYFVYSSIAAIIMVLFKRLYRCPVNQNGYWDPKTGALKLNGKKNIINNIKNWFNIPSIKYNEKIKELMKKENITIGEIKNILSNIKLKDLSHMLQSFLGSGVMRTNTQQTIDNIISNIDCVCSTSNFYTQNDIINPKCIENIKNNKYNDNLEDLFKTIKKEGCTNFNINTNINSFDDMTINIQFPPNSNCVVDNIINNQDLILQSDEEQQKIEKENNIFTKIKNKFI